VVWTLTLQPESEGPALISYAARLLSGGHSGLLSTPSWRTIVGIPMQRGSQFLRIPSPMPHLIEQVEIDIAVER
jgi:hypothetical protein